MAVTVPAAMGLSLGNRIVILISAAVLVCSCEKHQPGEYPEVQRDRTVEEAKAPAAAQAETAPAASASASPKPTAVEFFPTKPR